MINNQKGQILVVVFIALGVVLFTVLSVIAGAQIYFQNASYTLDSEKATALAEAGLDKAIASLNKTGGNFNPDPNQEIALGGGTFTLKLTTLDAATKLVEATGYIPDKSKSKVRRTVKMKASKGVGVAFVYGIQVGEGGLVLGHGNTITGSIYSNGNVIADHDNQITGDVWVAGGSQAMADQQTDCQDSNCSHFIFGKYEGDIGIDAAQSFRPAVSGLLNKVSLKLKKIGQPSDVTVRILGDLSGAPNKNQVLATGTLYSSLVSSNYGWIEVTFNQSPQLSVDTSYWIMIDTASNSTNFWNWQNDLAQSYNRGLIKWSPSWNDKKENWYSYLGDLSFKTFMGGVPTYVDGGQTFSVGGDVHANTIKNSTITGAAYYNNILNSTASSYHPNSEDPPPKVFPISDSNITDWQGQAEGAGVKTGDITSCVSTLDVGKIVGNVNLAGCTITVKTPIWITGNVTLDNNNIIKLDPSYGTTSGVIIVDGLVELKNNNQLKGSGAGSSMLLVLSTYDSRSNNIPAIAVKNNGNSGVFYANKGIIEPGANNTYKELTAWGIRIVSNSILNYETGLSNTLFSSGPSGSFSLIKGSYQQK